MLQKITDRTTVKQIFPQFSGGSCYNQLAAATCKLRSALKPNHSLSLKPVLWPAFSVKHPRFARGQDLRWRAVTAKGGGGEKVEPEEEQRKETVIGSQLPACHSLWAQCADN